MSTMLLVQGDTRTQIKTTITRAYDGAAVDLTGTSSVVMRFRKTYTKAILFTLTATEAASGDFAKGEAIFTFASGDLNIDAGDYEGEIELTYSNDGAKETVFEVISFILRDEFA